ncbi:class I SAM-dependent methyltransferase [Streptomyces sp. NEAU-sy36]|uniref:class I SAM-dependent methyltransferase n=1 Tax=unclassified Streptomyces TaxID=2593676 RepID=UPI0015D603FE|nr:MULTISPECIES: class I SAM-dependent methyltransferase [unclassified Streptomyces]QLJ03411.1 class I SAM-dependent methyltransferase [Streptomyces sp. NEAU-sy36]
MTSTLKHGDFTSLAEDYSKYREGYAPSVLSALIGLLGGSAEACDAVDVGAGTGIWSRMLAEAGFRSVTSVDPNDTMRATGERDSAHHDIIWRAGSGEDTGLPSASADLVTMASSFHWVDFDKGTQEFSRLLRPGGWFVALWNPRYIQASPLLTDIEAELERLKPDMKRVSSARQGLMDELSDRLAASPHFDDVILLEGRHHVRQTVDHYIGVWRSVNDVRVQLGEEKFEQFLDYARRRIGDAETVETTYLTRAWAARRTTA